MKTTFLILLITFNFLSSKSYSQKIISLTAITDGVYSFNNYSKIDVICNLPDSINLGYIPSDIPNDRKLIKSSSAVTTWLQSFADKQFSSGEDSKAKKILWVIHDLSVGKDSTQKEVHSFVKIKADIYTGNEASITNYELTNTYDSTWVTTNNNVDFGEMIAKAFIQLNNNSIEQRRSVANDRFQQLTKKYAGTKANIEKQVELSNNFSILKSAKYADGVYRSFNEFKNNAPSVNSFYADVNPETNHVNLYQIGADSSSEVIEKAWGLAVNNELYFYAEGQLYPIERSGNTFYIAKYLEPATRKNQAFYWRKIIGQKQGNTNPFNDAHILRRSVPTAKNVSIEATHLDFDLENFIY